MDVTARPANLHDVARIAGVSHQTVSRVINGHPSLRPDTRDRVLAAIEELRYRPNQSARTLATRTSRTLGVVSSSAPNYGPSSTLAGFVTACGEATYGVRVANLGGVSGLVGAVDALVGQGVDGVVVVAATVDELAALEDLTPTKPLVVVTSQAGVPFSTVSVDQTSGATLATRHLIDQGHRHILHVAGPKTFPDANVRRAGWEATMRQAGLEVPVPLHGDWSAQAGYAIGIELADEPAFTAIFSGNDQMALGLVHALTSRGIRVPEDVSVVGFDDLPESAHFLPPLTTIRQDFDDVGREIVRVMLSLLGDQAPESVLIRPRLVERESVRAASAI